MKRPWLSYGTALVAAYGLKLCYSRAAAGDLAWILVPTARAVGWLRGETLTFTPNGANTGWVAPDGSYFIAPACAGVNFLILALILSVLGFSHRLRSPGARFGWWWASLGGAYLFTIAVNTLRIVAAVALYRLGPVAGLSSGQLHRLLGTILYLGALGGLAIALDRATARRAGPGSGAVTPAGGLLAAGTYLGMTLVVPLLTGHPGGRYAEHAVTVALSAALFLAVYFALRRGERHRWTNR